MAAKEIEVTEFETVGELLTSSHSLEIPLNQRSLEWGLDDMLRVWRDLKEATDSDRVHFMGFMVFQTSGTKAKPIFIVQDGQQRLMCLVSIAAILYRLLKDRAPKVSDDEQHDLFTMFNNRGNPRLLLDVHHAHLSQLLKSGQAGSPAAAERRSAARFAKAFSSLAKAISDDLSSLKGQQLADWVASYVSAVRDRVLVTAIAVDSPALALKIFYRLNSGGVKLSQSDTAKNLAYLEAERSSIPESEVTTRWNELVDLVPYDNLTSFLRYWTEMKEGTAIREKDLHEYLTAQCQAGVIEFLDALLRSAHSLDRWWNGKSGANLKVAEAFKLLGRPALAYPLLWTCDELVSSGQLTNRDCNRIARSLESYIFRELSVGKRKTDEIREHLIEFAQVLRANGVESAIDTMHERSPDAGFQQKFELWVTRNKAKQFYVVREIERKLSGGQPSPGASYEWTDDKSTRAWEIEHICPVKKSDTLTVEVNRIGNLVLLEKALNQACKKKDFHEKRTLYKSGRKATRGRRALEPSKMSAVTGSNFSPGIDYKALASMTRVDTFGDKQISERQRSLAKLALRIWSFG